LNAEPLTAEAFAARCGVSRETLDRLRLYCELLRKWQGAVNLVSQASLADVWRRHIWDSAQLMPHLPGRTGRLLDVGSGAGLPGLVLAILGVEGVNLVESDKRKCAFLQEAARRTGAKVSIHAERFEALAEFVPPPDVITARAFAPLPLLLATVELYIRPNIVCLFHRGRQVDRELMSIREAWPVAVRKIPSATDPSGTIIRLEVKSGE
jgi:16S rRNA (guanine527-N7)-methyltransferase